VQHSKSYLVLVLTRRELRSDVSAGEGLSIQVFDAAPKVKRDRQHEILRAGTKDVASRFRMYEIRTNPAQPVRRLATDI